MSTISNEFAAELIAKLRAGVESRDELTADTPIDPCVLLILKLYDDIEAIKKGTAFLGVGGGIKAPTRVVG